MSVLKKPSSNKLWRVSILTKRWSGRALERAAADTETMSGCWCCHIALLVVHHNKCRRRCGHSCQGFRAAAKKKRSKSINIEQYSFSCLNFMKKWWFSTVLWHWLWQWYSGGWIVSSKEWVRYMCVCVCVLLQTFGGQDTWDVAHLFAEGVARRY